MLLQKTTPPRYPQDILIRCSALPADAARTPHAAQLSPRHATQDGASPQRNKPRQERYPVLWQAAALYCGGGLAVSAYQLLNADCREAIEKAHTDAWGARRRLEGFDEVLEWLEWSEAGVGCDVAPKLVRQGALAAAVDGLRSDDLDVRCAAAATLAASRATTSSRGGAVPRKTRGRRSSRPWSAARIKQGRRASTSTSATPRSPTPRPGPTRAHEATLLLVAANLGARLAFWW